MRPAVKEINGNIDSKLAPIGHQLEDLSEKVGKLEGRFEQLDRDQKRLSAQMGDLPSLIIRSLAPEKSMSTSKLAENFSRTNLFVETALKTKLVANPKLLDPAVIQMQDVLRTESLPKTVLIKGVSAIVHVDAYKSFSQSMLAGLPEKEFFVSGVNLVGNNAPGEEGFGGLRQNKHRAVIYRVTLRNMIQEIADIRWIKVDFEGVSILYDGDDLFLADVTFKNCTFEQIHVGPQADELSKKVIAQLEKTNNGQPVSLVVTKGYSSLEQ